MDNINTVSEEISKAEISLANKIVDRLLTIKSLTTLILTIVFAILCCSGKLDKDFLVIYSVVISFYFGTQHNK